MLSRRLFALGAGSLAFGGCGLAGRQRDDAAAAPAAPSSPDAAIAFRAGAAVPQELQWARTAWRYVENNTDYGTGLVNGTDRAPVFTIANAADALAATVAARELRVIDAREFDQRMGRLLGFLGSMDLSQGLLPNKAYHAGSGKMVGFDGQPADIGWSAVDVGRLLLWLKITGQRHPVLAEYADKAVLRFSYCEVIDDCGTLFGSARTGGQLHRYQEGRLGYEQLAAAGYAAWGFDARRSLAPARTETTRVLGLPLRHDARDPRTSGAQAPVLTMPYVLMGLELGWQHPWAQAMKPLADEVFRVQEERFRRERQLTARTDYQMASPPWVVLDSVYASGYAFNTLAGDGREFEKLALVSTRAAFGMAALWPGDYAQRLLEGVRFLYDPDRGWFEGRLETGAPHPFITLATNAGVLEALLFKARGPLYLREEQPGPFRVQTADPFLRLNRCWPRERVACRPTAGT
jgi:hypothetical protein